MGDRQNAIFVLVEVLHLHQLDLLGNADYVELLDTMQDLVTISSSLMVLMNTVIYNFLSLRHDFEPTKIDFSTKLLPNILEFFGAPVCKVWWATELYWLKYPKHA